MSGLPADHPRLTAPAPRRETKPEEPARRVALQAARDIEQAIRYLSSGRPESALRVLIHAADTVRFDLRHLPPARRT
jgi:hypothetical protein